MSGLDARGGALVPALSLLLLLALLATLSLMAGGADLLLAARFARERAAFHAAEAGLAGVLTELRRDDLVPPEAFHPPWADPAVPERRWREGDWELSRRVRILADARNCDGDESTPVVLYNRSFGYAGSSRERGGFPVFQALVSASSGESRHAVVAEVAPVGCFPEVPAAWLAAGPLSLSGRFHISGAPHGADGTPIPGAEQQPAVISAGEIRLADGAEAEGLGCVGSAAVVGGASTPVPNDPLAALNAGDTLERLEDLSPPPADRALTGVAWSRGDYAGGLDGEGVLLVHNPDFDPVRHEASRLVLEEGVVTPEWDPSYSHLDPARRPARLQVVRGGAFRGVLIADALGACEQELALTGALVTLSRSPLEVRASAPFRISYSPAAAQSAGRGPLAHLAAFRPLPATPSRTD